MGDSLSRWPLRFKSLLNLFEGFFDSLDCLIEPIQPIDDERKDGDVDDEVIEGVDFSSHHLTILGESRFCSYADIQCALRRGDCFLKKFHPLVLRTHPDSRGLLASDFFEYPTSVDVRQNWCYHILQQHVRGDAHQ